MTSEIYNLIITAHPDDETIYFSGPILKCSEHPWKVICVTNGNADGKGESRSAQLKKACELLKVDSYEQWDFPDIFEDRLNIKKLVSKLETLKIPLNIYTHGIIGEYSHPHHQDVSFAVHSAFNGKIDIKSVSYNTYPDEFHELTRSEYALKTDILSGIYADEMNRFLHLVPATAIDSYTQVSFKEVSVIYNYLTEKSRLNIDDLDKYRWLYGHIIEALRTPNKRLF